MKSDNSGPLRDLRVIELGQLIAGPFCGQLLGDMGADVIKVEPPLVGDPLRGWGQIPQKMWWEVVARNKRSVTADLRRAEGQALVRALAKQADVLIENFKPGTLESWNLPPASLLEDNPRLIILRVSGYGQTGPYASRPGYGSIGEAIGGLRYVVGDQDRPPVRTGISIGDTLAATFGCVGVLAALHARETTGRGQIVDSAIYEAVLGVMESLVADYSVAGFVRERSGSILPRVAPSNVYSCKDGAYLIAANQDAIFARLARAMDRPELAQDARFVDHHARGQHQEELDELINNWTRSRTVAEVEQRMVENGVPSGMIYTAAEMVDDPHFAERGALIEAESPRWGTFRMQNAFPKFSDTPGSVRRLAPAVVGQDNADIYGDLLNLNHQDLADLKERGII